MIRDPEPRVGLVESRNLQKSTGGGPSAQSAKEGPQRPEGPLVSSPQLDEVLSPGLPGRSGGSERVGTPTVPEIAEKFEGRARDATVSSQEV